MRLPDDICKAVVFIGFAGVDGEDFHAVGTAFLIAYKGFGYLVTARHIAVSVGDDPYHIRMNKKTGGSGLIIVDPLMDKNVAWTTPEDSDVDIAILEFQYDLKQLDFDVCILMATCLSTKPPLKVDL